MGAAFSWEGIERGSGIGENSSVVLQRMGVHHRSEDSGCDLWHDGVSEGVDSVYPIGYPIHVSHHCGHSGPPIQSAKSPR